MCDAQDNSIRSQTARFNSYAPTIQVAITRSSEFDPLICVFVCGCACVGLRWSVWLHMLVHVSHCVFRLYRCLFVCLKGSCGP